MTYPTPPNTELAEAIDNIKDMSGTYCHLNAKDIRDVQTILKAARAHLSTLTRPTQSGVDLSGLKLEVKKYLDSKADGYWWDDAIDYLASRNLITAKRTEGWQDISTAPRDGTSILVYGTRPRTGDSWQDVVQYSDFYGMFMSGSKSVGHDFLTHWMPLPPQPTAEDRGV